ASRDVWNPFPKNLDNKRCNKCFVGVGVLMTPFFLLAYFLSYLFGYPLDGVSHIFQVFVSVAALFYLIAGLVYLRKLFKLYNLPEKGVSLILILVVFATNLFYYAVMEPSMSHVYSFCMACVFLYNAKKFSDSDAIKNLFGIGISLAILVIIRPTNVLSVLFIPFVCQSYTGFSGFIKKLFSSGKVLPVVLLSACIVFIQPLVWFLQTGSFFVYSYPGESFYFNHPRFIDILFSYKNGWYLYTPLMFFTGLGSLIVLWMKNKFQLICFILFTVIIIYVLSSWWCWWYGGFGNRAFIDFYPEFALALGMVFMYLRSRMSWSLVIAISILCVFFNIFQTLQYYNFIIPYGDMNKEKYWKIFLKRDNYYVGIFSYPDTTLYNTVPGYTYINGFATVADNKYIANDITYSGIHPLVVTKENPTYMIYSSKVSGLPKDKFLNLFLTLFESVPDFDNRLAFNVKIQAINGDIYYSKVVPLLGFSSAKNTWYEAYSILPLPQFKDSTDILVVSVENPVSKAYFEQVKIRFATPK
ncbi:MAG TPA: hypothetical protein VK809_03385, partial [Bacteroidia bacterium]|nr:hypothetical protein [Bacteroidia bacterium]